VAGLDEGELLFSLFMMSMLRRFRAGEKGFLLMKSLKSTKSFSIESELMLSPRHGLMGQGRGLDGGLFVVKKEMSSDALNVIL
jgi:hypothetical protein